MKYIDNEKERIKLTLQSSFSNTVNDLFFNLGLVKKLASEAAGILDNSQYDSICDLLDSSADSLEHAYTNLGACLDLVDDLDTYVEIDDEVGWEYERGNAY